MSQDIITFNKTQQVTKKIRAPRVIIENNYGNHDVVHFINSEATFLDGVYKGEEQVSEFTKVISADILNETIQYTDPVTGVEQTIKVYNICAAIDNAYVKWYLEWDKNNNEEENCRINES